MIKPFKLISILFMLNISMSCFSQKNSIYLIFYGNCKYMEKTTNLKEYIFKDGIQDGRWKAFYDKKHTDTALVCTILNGKINGELIRWDKKKKYIIERCEYKDGKMNGIRRTYLMIGGIIYENQYRYENNELKEYLKIEW